MTHKSSLCTAGAAIGLILWSGLSLSASDRGESSSYLKYPLPAQWSQDSVMSAGKSASASEAWWRTFDDPLLDSLIALGERNNYDVSMAARRIEMSRAAIRQAQSAYYPQIGIDLGWTRERQSGRIAGPDGAATVTSWFGASASMSWEVDVFGKIRAQVNKSKQSARVTAAEYRGAMLTLEAEIATSYISLLVDRAQLAVAQEHTENQLHILDITETRHRTGLVSGLDVAQAKTLYYSTVSSIPLLEASIEALYNSLAVLCGVPRSELPASLYDEHPLPSHYDLAAMGAPVDVIRNRPDVVQAERSIDVAAAELGIARSAYLPSLSVSASAGTQAHRFGDLFSRPSFGYTIAPTLSWTLFDGLSRHAATVEAREAMRLQVDNYNLTVQTAIEEVNNAMARYAATLQYIDRIEKVVENGSDAVRLSLDQYKQGLCDFYNVVEAQLTYLTYQNSLAAGRGQALTSLIDLYKALGGSYTVNSYDYEN